jgi:hypothetical protein
LALEAAILYHTLNFRFFQYFLVGVMKPPQTAGKEGCVMSEICDVYSEGIKRKFRNYWAAWKPDSQYKLGDIGTMKGQIFEKCGSLEDMNVSFTASQAARPSPLNLSSDGGVKMSIKAVGETNNAFPNIPAAKAVCKIAFSKQGAFVIQCPETYERSFDSLLRVQDRVMDLYNQKLWEMNWHVISKIVYAPTGTILISDSEVSEAEFLADVDLDTALGALGKANVGMTRGNWSGAILETVGGNDLTPIFQLTKLKRRVVRPPRLAVPMIPGQASEMSGEEELAELQLELVTDDEILTA